jgi:hypothetical protein
MCGWREEKREKRGCGEESFFCCWKLMLWEGIYENLEIKPARVVFHGDFFPRVITYLNES